MKRGRTKQHKWTQINLFLEENNEDKGEKKHAVTLSIYT